MYISFFHMCRHPIRVQYLQCGVSFTAAEWELSAKEMCSYSLQSPAYYLLFKVKLLVTAQTWIITYPGFFQTPKWCGSGYFKRYWFVCCWGHEMKLKSLMKELSYNRWDQIREKIADLFARDKLQMRWSALAPFTFYKRVEFHYDQIRKSSDHQERV